MRQYCSSLTTVELDQPQTNDDIDVSDKMSEEKKAIVLDNGSSTIRAGFSGDEAPKTEIRNVVGHAKQSTGADSRSEYVGGEALTMRGVLEFEYPINRGIITNWDDMQTIWQYIFANELRIDATNNPIVVTEPLLEQTANREKMAEVLFETFKFPALYVARQAAMSMYASGRRTGLVLQSGDSVTEAMAMVEGFMVPESIQRFSLAGRDLTNNFAARLNDAGHSFRSSSEKELVRDMKETVCYVKHSKSNESGDKAHNLPNGQALQLTDADRYSVFESMFQPDNDYGEGVQKTVHSAISKCDINNRKELWQNIILSGANTMCVGFADRLKEELVPLVPSTIDVRVHSAPHRQYAAWIGASIMVSLPTFNKMWVSKKDYDESGPSIVSRKCI